MEFFEAVNRRRSIRRYSATPVPAEIMTRAFEAAQLAPNSSNLQTWEFTWVRTAEKKQALIEACLGQGAARTAQELVVVASRRDNWKKHSRALYEGLQAAQSPVLKAQQDYYGKLIPFFYGKTWLSPFKWAAFNTIGLFRPLMRRPAWGRDLDEVSIKSAALAAENFMLAIAAQNFDTCPMEGFDEVRVKKVIGAKWSTRIVMVISVGERDTKGVWGVRTRFPRDWFLKEV